jgi:hypothetical protein
MITGLERVHIVPLRVLARAIIKSYTNVVLSRRLRYGNGERRVQGRDLVWKKRWNLESCERGVLLTDRAFRSKRAKGRRLDS